jgi:hypothetical protein
VSEGSLLCSAVLRCTSGTNRRQSCKPSTSLRGCDRPSPLRFRAGIGARGASRQVRLSTLRYLSKYCGFAPRGPHGRQCAMPTSFGCQRSTFHPLLPVGTSPLPAERRFGLEPQRRIKLFPAIKNPASSAGHFRPFLGTVSRPLERKNSKLDSYYPVLVTNLTSGLSRQVRLSAHSRSWQGCADIRKLYRNLVFRQALFNFLSYSCLTPPVEFTSFCGNCEALALNDSSFARISGFSCHSLSFRIAAHLSRPRQSLEVFSKKPPHRFAGYPRSPRRTRPEKSRTVLFVPTPCARYIFFTHYLLDMHRGSAYQPTGFISGAPRRLAVLSSETFVACSFHWRKMLAQMVACVSSDPGWNPFSCSEARISVNLNLNRRDVWPAK